MRGFIPPLSQYVFMAWFLLKQRDNFAYRAVFTSVTPLYKHTYFVYLKSLYKINVLYLNSSLRIITKLL